MEKNYWLERWKQKDIKFHQDKINPYLYQYWKKLDLGRGDLVFVPLCGKSQDMLWLQRQGYKVLGVEISDIAVEAFFNENNLIPEHTWYKKFNRYDTDNIIIFKGDFFNLDREDLVKVSAVYDRASLVALPHSIRGKYVSHLLKILSPGTQILLVTFEYSQFEMQGPPFSVPVREIEELFSKYSSICLLERLSVMEQYPRFYERGVSKLYENIFLVTMDK